MTRPSAGPGIFQAMPAIQIIPYHGNCFSLKAPETTASGLKPKEVVAVSRAGLKNLIPQQFERR